MKGSTEAWRRSIQDRDPLPAARRLHMPVLILQGLTDPAVSPEDAHMLGGAVARGARRVPEVQPVLEPACVRSIPSK